METIDCAVVGAGVVGLAAARALALAGREVLVLEAAEAVGTGISSRNSEVVHAGLYYPPGSLKARLCREGRERLYAFCAERGVAHRRPGKLVVAGAEGETAALRRLRATAEANGVDDLEWLSATEARAREPALRCTAALLSPSTGIVDSHGLMVALRAEAEGKGAFLVLRSPVLGGRAVEGGIVLEVGGHDPTRILCRCVVNSAGLGAIPLARSLEGPAPGTVPRGYLCKGSYFTLARRAPFRHLVYPAPEQAGLGVHLTLDLGGLPRFGPDVEWVEAEDYRVDPGRAGAFAAAVRRYWPGLPAEALQPGYAGIRPKIVGPGEPAADFVVQGPEAHGVPGLVNLFGIESPGLTACLALADEAALRLAAGG
ncbi:MAG: NAD(P)/FAD-dependent oxidoreductase [Deferrisomatales bacterium]